jgi:2-haloacid dehalogenase
MMTERWITFDCFGTLINWHAGFRAVIAPIAGERTDALIAAYHGVERTLEIERPHRLYCDVLTAGLTRAARQIGFELLPAQENALVRQWGELPLYDDVPAALSALRMHGFKIGILTNCDDELFARTLKKFPDLRPDLIITAEQVGSYKPALGHFQQFAAKTGIPHHNWVHAACSWFHDIEPAHRVGCARVWVDRDRTGDDPRMASCVIPDLSSLPEVAAALVK